MSFKDLSKQQQQMAILGVMGIVVFFALGNQMVMAPAKSAAEKAALVIEEKEEEKTKGERFLARALEVHQAWKDDTSAIMDAREKDLIPPETGKEFWAQRRIRRVGYELNIDLSVNEFRQSRAMGLLDEKALEKASFWVPYAARVSVETGFFRLNDLMTALTNAEPYASISQLQITPSNETPEVHEIRFLVEWPVPREEQAWLDLEQEYVEFSGE